MTLSDTEIIINTIKDNIETNHNKEFNAQLLLFIGITTNNIPYINYALDNGADVNQPMSPHIKHMLNTMGLLTEDLNHHS